jgi:2,3,4,5-tetrahydropyridine-2-carboxylate N-succinyltransferase
MSKELFLKNLEAKTKAMPGIALAKIFAGSKLVRVLANAPGQSGSLRVLMNVLERESKRFNAQSLKQALDIFEPLVAETKTEPNKHPFIAFLLELQNLGNFDPLSVEVIEGSPNVLEALVKGEASREQKREVIEWLDRGQIRCAEKIWSLDGKSAIWIPQLYAIEAMNAVFSSFDFEVMHGAFYDKVPLKTSDWTKEQFEQSGVRFIPGSFVRKGAYVGKGTTVMPGGIVNSGAYVAGDGVMIDGGARVATGAQVGRGVKLGAGSGIEGILEPKGRLPSIIEDGAIIGANCEICGIVEERAIVASGVVMASGKKIFDLRTGKELTPRYMQIGERVVEIPYIPKERVAVSGIYMRGDFGISCILLLEKDASSTTLSEIPKNVDLYIRT